MGNSWARCNERAALQEKLQVDSPFSERTTGFEPATPTLPRWGSRVRIPSSAPKRGYLPAVSLVALPARCTLPMSCPWLAPYLTMAEGIKLTAQTFTTDVEKLSCCAA